MSLDLGMIFLPYHKIEFQGCTCWSLGEHLSSSFAREYDGLPWDFSEQPAPVPVEARTRSHGHGFLRVRVAGFINSKCVWFQILRPIKIN